MRIVQQLTSHLHGILHVCFPPLFVRVIPIGVRTCALECIQLSFNPSIPNSADRINIVTTSRCASFYKPERRDSATGQGCGLNRTFLQSHARTGAVLGSRIWFGHTGSSIRAPALFGLLRDTFRRKSSGCSGETSGCSRETSGCSLETSGCSGETIGRGERSAWSALDCFCFCVGVGRLAMLGATFNEVWCSVRVLDCVSAAGTLVRGLAVWDGRLVQQFELHGFIAEQVSVFVNGSQTVEDALLCLCQSLKFVFIRERSRVCVFTHGLHIVTSFPFTRHGEDPDELADPLLVFSIHSAVANIETIGASFWEGLQKQVKQPLELGFCHAADVSEVRVCSRVLH